MQGVAPAVFAPQTLYAVIHNGMARIRSSAVAPERKRGTIDEEIRYGAGFSSMMVHNTAPKQDIASALMRVVAAVAEWLDVSFIDTFFFVGNDSPCR